VTRDHVPYDQWLRDGSLVATSGNCIDYERIRVTLREWAAAYDLRELAFDPWNATDLVTRLQDQDGIACVAMRQGFAALSAPTKSLEQVILSKRLRHDGHPVLRWNISNIAVETDATGNLRLSKKVSTERIDGAAALVMALARLDANAGVAPPEYSVLVV
jgi:phage terminase large subunit-like protein